MKTTSEAGSNGKDRVDGAKAAAAKQPKRAAGKTGRAKSKTARRGSAASGYGDSAARLIARGKAAAGEAYAWAGEAGAALPAAARNLRLPDHAEVRSYMADRPLVLGVIGLGIGMALGAMAPMARTAAPAPARRTAKKRK